MLFKLTPIAIALSVFATTALASPATPPYVGGGEFPGYSSSVSLNTAYDNRELAISNLLCAYGDNGLIHKGYYSNIASIPSYPFVAGASVVENRNSPECGSCYELGHNGRNVYVTIVDKAEVGFEVPTAVFTQLTGDQPEGIKIDVTVRQVSASQCGM